MGVDRSGVRPQSKAWLARSAAVLGLLALSRALPAQEGAPGGGALPGDIPRPPSGAPAVPKAPGVPLSREESELEGKANGHAGLLQTIATATGTDATGLDAGGPWMPADLLIDAALFMASAPSVAGMSALPVPVVASSKNEGPTGGAMVAIFDTDRDGEVDFVATPILTYNQLFGVEGGSHFLMYRGNVALGLGAIVSNRVARNLYFNLFDEAVADTPLAVELIAKDEVDPSSRFYGFGPDTSLDDQTANTFYEAAFRSNLGWDVTPHLQIFWRERYRDVSIGASRVPGVPSTKAVYPNAPGTPGASILGSGIEVRWDERDNAFLPQWGWFVGAVAELNLGLTGNTQEYYPRYIVDLRGYVTPWEDVLTLCARLRIERLTGGDVPFYEQAILGGRNTLRAFGEDRFTDLASFLLQVEARFTVLRIPILGTRTIWQVVPFFDFGRVFHDFRNDLRNDWQPSPGLGVRVAIPTNIVIRLDVGYGIEGAALFLGLGLPF
jgi:hypothetical protein